mgnify:CR=1 FL=1
MRTLAVGPVRAAAKERTGPMRTADGLSQRRERWGLLAFNRGRPRGFVAAAAESARRLLRPSRGRATVLGMDTRGRSVEIRRRVGTQLGERTDRALDDPEVDCAIMNAAGEVVAAIRPAWTTDPSHPDPGQQQTKTRPWWKFWA